MYVDKDTKQSHRVELLEVEGLVLGIKFMLKMDRHKIMDTKKQPIHLNRGKECEKWIRHKLAPMRKVIRQSDTNLTNLSIG